MRIRNTISSLLVACLLAFTGCSGLNPTIKSLDELKTSTIAVPTGTIADQLVLSQLPDVKFIYFDTVAECCTAVQNGDADAAAYDEPVLRNLSAKMSGLTLLSEMITNDDYGIAVSKDRADLKADIDDAIAELKTDGTYDEMLSRWLPEAGDPGPMPSIDLNGTNGTLKLATSAVVEPFTYVADDDTIIGFDIELASRICLKLGMKLEIVNMDFAEMLPAVAAGQVDIAGACITISEERSETVLFSEPYYQGGIAAVVRK